ncbi:MAG: hypothetical protein R3C41_06985 [Calditrichia bacterium]
MKTSSKAFARCWDNLKSSLGFGIGDSNDTFRLDFCKTHHSQRKYGGNAAVATTILDHRENFGAKVQSFLRLFREFNEKYFGLAG